jgi:hypothetical protein
MVMKHVIVNAIRPQATLEDRLEGQKNAHDNG